MARNKNIKMLDISVREIFELGQPQKNPILNRFSRKHRKLVSLLLKFTCGIISFLIIDWFQKLLKE